MAPEGFHRGVDEGATSVSLATLVVTARPPTSRATWLAPSASRSATTMARAPSLEKRRHNALPMPGPAGDDDDFVLNLHNGLADPGFAMCNESRLYAGGFTAGIKPSPLAKSQTIRFSSGASRPPEFPGSSPGRDRR